MLKNSKFYSLFVLLSFISNFAFSQIDIDVKTNLLSITRPNLSVEMGAGKASIELSACYYKFSTATTGEYTTDIDGNLLSGSAASGAGNGFSFHLLPTFYVSPKYSLDGFKIAPYLNYDISNDPVYKTTRISAGGIIGYKGFFGTRLGWEFGLGFGKAFVNKSVDKATKVETDAKDLEAIPIIGKLFKNLANTDIPINLKLVYRFGEGYQY
jgi:Protein of unknown function (DUF3575)